MRLGRWVATWSLLATPAMAAPYNFIALPSTFEATALNDQGTIAGLQQPTIQGPGQLVLPAFFRNGVITSIANQPRSDSNVILGLNDIEDWVGTANSRFGRYATGDQNGQQIGFATPGEDSVANGLNANFQIVGSAATRISATDTVPHGFISVPMIGTMGSNYMLLDVPGATSTNPMDITDGGLVVGSFLQNGRQHGFTYVNDTFTTLDRPDAVATDLVGVANTGQIAGTYIDVQGNKHGFTWLAGAFTDIVGAAGQAFLPVDLNESGELIGKFAGQSLSYAAFVQTDPISVPEPTGLLSLVGAIGGVWVYRQRRSTDLVDKI